MLKHRVIFLLRLGGGWLIRLRVFDYPNWISMNWAELNPGWASMCSLCARIWAQRTHYTLFGPQLSACQTLYYHSVSHSFVDDDMIKNK